MQLTPFGFFFVSFDVFHGDTVVTALPVGLCQGPQHPESVSAGSKAPACPRTPPRHCFTNSSISCSLTFVRICNIKVLEAQGVELLYSP